MKKLFLVSSIIIQACIVFAQNCCVNDTIVREIQFPLTEQDTKTELFYYNNEWIAGALDLVPTDSIQKVEVKNDEYGNRALFLTLPPETLAQIKAEVRKRFINVDPRCEFPGGNGKLKEWIDENIRIPEGFKGRERVIVCFTVHPDGSISNPKIMRPSKNEAANQEALRLVNALPKFRVKYFTPRKYNFNYSIPIIFREPGAIFIRGDESDTHNQASTSSDGVNEPVIIGSDQLPYYLNGGEKGLFSDLYTTILATAPATHDSVKGRAALSFAIGKDGQIDPNSITVVRNWSVPDDYLNVAIEAIKKLGKFEPGKQLGTPKRVAYTILVKYPVPLDKINPAE